MWTANRDLWIAPLLALCLAAPALASAASAADDPGPRVIATVNGKELTQADFQTFVAGRAGDTQLTAQQIDMLFNEYINRELLYQDAVRKGWDEDPNVMRATNDARRNIVSGHAVRLILNEPIAEEELEAAYRELRPVREFQTRHILVGSEEDAREVVAQLADGASFEQLARDRSIDASAAQGGEIGWVAAEQMTPALREAITGMDKGSFSRQPIRTDFGWHILRVDDTRMVPTPPLDEVRDELRRRLHNQRVRDYLSELRREGEIEVR